MLYIVNNIILYHYDSNNFVRILGRKKIQKSKMKPVFCCLWSNICACVVAGWLVDWLATNQKKNLTRKISQNNKITLRISYLFYHYIAEFNNNNNNKNKVEPITNWKTPICFIEYIKWRVGIFTHTQTRTSSTISKCVAKKERRKSTI